MVKSSFKLNFSVFATALGRHSLLDYCIFCFTFQSLCQSFSCFVKLNFYVWHGAVNDIKLAEISTKSQRTKLTRLLV